MSGEAIASPPGAARPWAAAARAWLRPLPLAMTALAVTGAATLATLRRLIPPAPDEVVEAQLSVAFVTALLCAFAAAAIGFTWKRHICRPQARLAPRYRAIHGACAATALAVVAAVGSVGAVASGIAPLAGVAAAIVPTAIGAVIAFSPLLMALAGILLMASTVSLAAKPVGRAVADALDGRRLDAPIAALALAAAATAFGVRRLLAIDEDHIAYHMQLALGQPPVDAVRDNPLMRAIRAWDRRARAAAPAAALRPATASWALHRARLFMVAPWAATLAGDALILAAFTLVPVPDVAANTAIALVLLAPTTVFTRLLVPGFPRALALEALRPASRARDIASMLLAMLLAQTRAVALTTVAAAAFVALRAPARLGDLAAAAAAAVVAAPLIAAAALTLATVRGETRRLTALGALFMAAILAATAVQFAGARPGWICAAAAIADLVVVPLAWRLLIRIDIE